MILDRVSVIAAMAKKNITIAELSNLSTVSISTIGAARCGRGITKNSAKRIASALGVPLEELTAKKQQEVFIMQVNQFHQ